MEWSGAAGRYDHSGHLSGGSAWGGTLGSVMAPDGLPFSLMQREFDRSTRVFQNLGFLS